MLHCCTFKFYSAACIILSVIYLYYINLQSARHNYPRATTDEDCSLRAFAVSIACTDNMYNKHLLLYISVIACTVQLFKIVSRSSRRSLIKYLLIMYQNIIWRVSRLSEKPILCINIFCNRYYTVIPYGIWYFKNM
jgi:hypothetical protein